MNRIKKLRKEKGLTLEQLGSLMGTTGATVQRLESSNRKLSEKWMHRLKDALDVSISELLEEPSDSVPNGLLNKGDVRAGAWLELDDQQEVDAAVTDIMPDRRYPGARQFTLRVVGTSMNKYVQPGGRVIVVDWADLGLSEPKEDDVLVIRRQRAMTYETTLKRAKRGPSGWELWPESTDPRYQEPLTLTDNDHDVEVTIVGLVIGRYYDN
jgi:transcriptional regulator with XRE-family HTH domain